MSCLLNPFPFYGRDLELKKLKQWIVEDECRLSEIERQAIHSIGAEDRAISFRALIAASKISPTNLLEALQSLGRRRLVEKEETETGVLFNIQLILREFVNQL